MIRSWQESDGARRFASTAMRSLNFTPMLCVLLALLIASGAGAQGARAANTTLLIDLSQGPPPATISASGLYADTIQRQLAPGIVPYAVNAQLWSDGAWKERYLALPGTEQIGFSRDGNWVFPANSVLVKNFYLEQVYGDTSSRRLVETRFLIHGGAVMGWQGFSYLWNDAGTDADLLTTGASRTFSIEHAGSVSVQQLNYQFPASEDCQRCHTFGSGQVLGVRTAQLNRLDADGTHQLERLRQLGLFVENIGGDFDSMPKWADPADNSAPVSDRARAYLASNCSHCHLPGGLRRTEIDLRHDTPLADMGIVNQESSLDDLEGVDRRIVKPGDAANSVLLLRTLRLDERRMPPLATGVIDVMGTQLLRRWIEELGAATSVVQLSPLPAATTLGPAYPNPFNGATTLRFTVDVPSPVSLVVFDALGRKVRTLHSDHVPAGSYQVSWDGADDLGRPVASGVYLYRLVARDYRMTRRLTVLR